VKFGAIFLSLVALAGSVCFAQSTRVGTAISVSKPTVLGYVPVHTYRAGRDAAIDIDRAIAEAQKTGKRVIIDVGGDWCSWCHAMDQFFKDHPDLLQFREAKFVTVFVYSGPEGKNDGVLSRYSQVLGIPHYFVLDSDGTLLHSQHVAELQTDWAYSPEKMKEFLMKWSRPAAAPEKSDSGAIENSK
jgi:thiol:disulfide interchange protein